MALRNLLHSLLKRRFQLRFTSAQHASSLSNCLGCYDVAVIGGGIVGTATARQIKFQAPDLSCTIIEKENALASHQSGNNSGVIHAGIYYKPGSLRAQLCAEGLQLIYTYCEENEVPHDKCGKLIVATNEHEVERLTDIYKRGRENEVPDLQMVNGKDISDFEPAIRGLKAIFSPHTGIIDYGTLTRCFGRDFKEMGGNVILGFEANGFDISPESRHDSPDINKYPVKIFGKGGKNINAGFVLSCAGLQSAKVAALSGGSPIPAIIPFRGEYLKLTDNKKDLFKSLIYPVPDPRFPFLGIHITPTIHGDVLIGPNAVLALKREGYNKTDIALSDIFDYIKYRGFRKLASKHMKYGFEEWLNSLSIKRQLKQVQKLAPTISAEDLTSGWAGVRAQAVTEDGDLVDDFVFDCGTGPAKKLILHCRNAPSPAATSSMAIANVLADKVLKQMSSPRESEIKVKMI